MKLNNCQESICVFNMYIERLLIVCVTWKILASYSLSMPSHLFTIRQTLGGGWIQSTDNTVEMWKDLQKNCTEETDKV